MIWRLEDSIERISASCRGDEKVARGNQDYFREQIKHLLCEDPNEINRDWSDTPYIEEYLLR